VLGPPQKIIVFVSQPTIIEVGNIQKAYLDEKTGYIMKENWKFKDFIRYSKIWWVPRKQQSYLYIMTVLVLQFVMGY
jgi:hypothetical protein